MSRNLARKETSTTKVSKAQNHQRFLQDNSQSDNGTSVKFLHHLSFPPTINPRKQKNHIVIFWKLKWSWCDSNDLSLFFDFIYGNLIIWRFIFRMIIQQKFNKFYFLSNRDDLSVFLILLRFPRDSEVQAKKFRFLTWIGSEGLESHSKAQNIWKWDLEMIKFRKKKLLISLKQKIYVFGEYISHVEWINKLTNLCNISIFY